jgi:hypothetical protein
MIHQYHVSKGKQTHGLYLNLASKSLTMLKSPMNLMQRMVKRNGKMP